jgi:hypothetical protein
MPGNRILRLLYRCKENVRRLENVRQKDEGTVSICNLKRPRSLICEDIYDYDDHCNLTSQPFSENFNKILRIETRSRESSVSIVTRTTGIFFFITTTVSRTALGPTQPPIHWVPGALSLGIKRPGCEADHSPPSSAEDKNERSYTSSPQYVFMEWCLIKHSIRRGVVFTRLYPKVSGQATWSENCKWYSSLPLPTAPVLMFV